MTYIILIQVFFVLWNIANAYHDAWRIKRNLKVSHFWNALLYVILCVGVMFFFGWLRALPLLFLRPVIFDPMLNLFRNLPFLHQSRTTTSFVDKMENSLLGKHAGKAYFFYLIGFIVLDLIIFL